MPTRIFSNETFQLQKKGKFIKISLLKEGKDIRVWRDVLIPLNKIINPNGGYIGNVLCEKVILLKEVSPCGELRAELVNLGTLAIAVWLPEHNGYCVESSRIPDLNTGEIICI